MGDRCQSRSDCFCHFNGQFPCLAGVQNDILHVNSGHITLIWSAPFWRDWILFLGLIFTGFKSIKRLVDRNIGRNMSNELVMIRYGSVFTPPFFEHGLERAVINKEYGYNF